MSCRPDLRVIMRMHLLRPAAATAAIALLASGCGLVGSPSLSTSDEVIAALTSMHSQSMRMRATLDMTLDEGELRAAVRADESVLELFDDVEGRDVDSVIAEMAEMKAEADRHALLVAVGNDGSSSFTVESDGTEWAQLQVASSYDADGEPVQSFDLDVNLKVDWDFASTLFDDQSVAEGIESASVGLRAVAPELVTQMPSLQPLLDMATAFLAGERAGFSGTFDAQAWIDTLGSYTAGMFDLDEVAGQLNGGTTGPFSFDPAEYAEFLVFENFRVEGGLTKTDVSIRARDAANAYVADLQDLFEGDTTELGLTDEEVQQLRDEMTAEYAKTVDDIPELITNAATLSFDGDVMTEMRLNLLDIAVQVGEALEPDDEEIQALSNARAQLTETGMFITMAFSDVGNVDSVLTTDGTTVSWEELRGIAEEAGGLFGSLLGSTGIPFGGGSAFGAVGSEPDGDLTLPQSSFSFELAITPADVTPGDCFDDAGLYANAADGPQLFSCALPHDSEVFGMVELVGDDHGQAILGAYDACQPLFESYVGVSYLDSELFFSTLDPTAEAFADGARTSACYLFSFEPTTGTAIGSRR